MNFSDDDKHRATLTMLQETLAYLERLPPVPVTRGFCARLRAHLDEPTQRLVAQGRRELYGGFFTAVGLPVLEASVTDDVLSICIPTKLTRSADREAALREVGKLLAKGPIALDLKSRNAANGD